MWRGRPRCRLAGLGLGADAEEEPRPWAWRRLSVSLWKSCCAPFNGDSEQYKSMRKGTFSLKIVCFNEIFLFSLFNLFLLKRNSSFFLF